MVLLGIDPHETKRNGIEPRSLPISVASYGRRRSLGCHWDVTGMSLALKPFKVALRARVVFAEHRFYGQSLPFGPASWRFFRDIFGEKSGGLNGFDNLIFMK